MIPRVITFDNLTVPNFPENYAGFTWTGTFALGSFTWPLGGDINIYLGAARTQTMPPGIVTISRAGHPFDLIGMFLSLDPTAPPIDITVEGWKNNQKNYTRVIQKLNKDWRFVEFLFMDIDTIKINPHIESIHIDNIIINEP